MENGLQIIRGYELKLLKGSKNSKVKSKKQYNRLEEDMFIFEEEKAVYNIRHRAFYFSKEIVLFVGRNNKESIYFSIFDQLLRSATSIGANLVEGMAGASIKDFLKFYIIALKSANETKYWLCLIRDTLNIDKKEIEKYITEANELSKIIATIIINTKKQ